MTHGHLDFERWPCAFFYFFGLGGLLFLNLLKVTPLFLHNENQNHDFLLVVLANNNHFTSPGALKGANYMQTLIHVGGVYDCPTPFFVYSFRLVFKENIFHHEVCR